MIRVVVQTSDCSMAANVGGSVDVEIKTFDLEAPSLEGYLRQYETAREAGTATYWHRNVIGVELLSVSSVKGTA